MPTVLRWLLAAAFACGSGAACAQKLIGDRGASCVAIPTGGGTHSIVLSGAVPAGATLLIAAGTTGNATYASTTDSTGANTYTPTNSLLATFRGFTIHGRVDSALAAGQTVTISYSSAAPGGQTSCATIAAFSAVALAPLPPDDAFGTASGVSSSPMVSLSSPTTQARELLHAAFVLGAVPNGIGIPSPFNPLQTACVDGNAFCVAHGYRLVATTGAWSGAATLGSSVPWVATMVSYFSDVVFASGFD